MAEGYIEEYLPKLMTGVKEENEQYTYGERLSGYPIFAEGERQFVNQIEEVIKMYKEDGHGTNQACMEVAMPSDIILDDPPCLRLIDTMIVDGKLEFYVYFRSWDLWNGLPANLGALVLVEYMAEIEVANGFFTDKSIKFIGYEYD